MNKIPSRQTQSGTGALFLPQLDGLNLLNTVLISDTTMTLKAGGGSIVIGGEPTTGLIIDSSRLLFNGNSIPVSGVLSGNVVWTASVSGTYYADFSIPCNPTSIVQVTTINCDIVTANYCWIVTVTPALGSIRIWVADSPDSHNKSQLNFSYMIT